MALVRLSLILLLAGLGTMVARGQDQVPEAADAEAVPDTLVQRVSTAFRTGDARRLLSPTPDRVELSLFGTRTFYSSAQAFYVLRDFFETHPPAGFALSDATVAGESCFLRGRLKHTRSERPYQVYVRLVHHEDGSWRLHEVRIDVEAE